MMNTITQLELQISEAVADRAWQQCQSYITPRGQWNAYLNQICCQTVLPWLQTEYAPQSLLSLEAGDLVQGSAIDWGEKRLILIPDRTVDTDEFRVPQEWVDVPSWLGDYYLAVQVDPDDLQVRIWAYTTHEQIKAIAEYDSDDRAYCLDRHSLIQDISVLWVVRQLYPEEPTRAAIAELSPASQTQSENLLQRLASIDQPRLELPFTLWGALLDSPSWVATFQQLRQGRTVINLRQWLENTFTAGWSAIESWLNPEELALGLRQDAGELTWIRRVKRLEIEGHSILLLISLAEEADERVSVRVQVRPVERLQHLPLNLSLSLIAASGNVVQSVQARSQDDSIQLRRFKCPVSTEFGLQLALEDTILTETFQC